MSRSNELKKILKNSNFHRVGRINKRVADKAHIKCADVYISSSNLKHIAVKHGVELEKLGLSPILLVKTILSNYNRVYEGSGDSKLLVIFEEDKNSHLSTAITINYISKKGFWEVRTAQPRNTNDLKKRKRIW